MSDRQLIYPMIPFEQIYYKKIKKNILGKWNKINSGGCSSEPSFNQNP